MLLIVTNRKDRTADWLVVELHRRRARFVRFNTEDYPSATALSWTPAGARLRLPGADIDLNDVTAVWYRRPVPPAPDPQLHHGRAKWVQNESREALEGVWRTLDALWVNHPDRNQAASSKPAQLQVAAELGFQVPESLVTNDPDAARAFTAARPTGVVVKPLRSGRIDVDGAEKLFFTTRIDTLPEIPWERLGSEPYLFQAFVDKTADIRATVIGDDVYAVRIDSQQLDATRTDFRRSDPTRLKHSAVQLPNDVAERCVRLVAQFGCRFGAIDLADSDDGPWFLENNPAGQWAWVEQMTGVPLRARLADLLTRPSS